MAVKRYQDAAEEHRCMVQRERLSMKKELAEIGRRLERVQVMFMEGRSTRSFLRREPRRWKRAGMS